MALYNMWCEVMKDIEARYMFLIRLGATPQEARSVLPNSLKTEIIMTMNIREWRHFFRVRASEKAHPQMQEVSYAILKMFKARFVVLFDEFQVYDGVLADIIN